MIAMLISSFLTYTLITAFTPGPNNILAMSSVTQYGFRRSISVLSGMSLGFFVIMVLCAVFTLSLVTVLPIFMGWLKWIGAAYILWLAWKIAKSQTSTSKAEVKPISFWMSFWLQFVNVKIILYGITAISTFALPYSNNILVIFGMSIILSVIGIAGNLAWALAGHYLQIVFSKHGKVINYILSVLLVYCAIKIVI
ncbi:cysteine/O-acetylserine transporter [Providencia sp.]|uniref:cysteine/O-acetylserine transporter n=1 Tax=Providencia sp. TaxID=589 RepID=UPI003F955131